MTISENQEQAALEARRAYYKEWRAKNRERTKEYARRYWQRRAQQATAEAGSQTQEACNEER